MRYDKVISIRVSQKMYDELSMLAEKDYITLSAYVKQAIAEKVRK